MTTFIIGFVLSMGIACYYLHEQQKRYDRLYADFLKLVNEVSMRSGGRAVFKDKKSTPAQSDEPTLDRGEFQLMTPSMAEYEAMDRDERDNGSNLDDVDIEHLRRSGVIN